MKNPLYRRSSTEAEVLAKQILAGPDGGISVLVAALNACSELVDDINGAGGVVTRGDGICYPVADEEWTSLAETGVHAASVLQLAGIPDEKLLVEGEATDDDGDESDQ